MVFSPQDILYVMNVSEGIRGTIAYQVDNRLRVETDQSFAYTIYVSQFLERVNEMYLGDDYRAVGLVALSKGVSVTCVPTEATTPVRVITAGAGKQMRLFDVS